MIRPYQTQDYEDILQLLRLNSPEYFAYSEEADFITYLAEEAEDYYVVEEAGQIIGSGGINWLEDRRVARISWDMIHPQHQGKGIGKALTLFRIEQIKAQSKTEVIYVRTSQIAHRFYEKLGFTLEKTERDFWAKGFDLYQMKIDLK